MTNKKQTHIGLMMDERVYNAAKQQTLKQFEVGISQSAIIRTLLGCYSEGRIQLDIRDIMKYSPESLGILAKFIELEAQ